MHCLTIAPYDVLLLGIAVPWVTDGNIVSLHAPWLLVSAPLEPLSLVAQNAIDQLMSWTLAQPHR